jgi:hypothetical protein
MDAPASRGMKQRLLLAPAKEANWDVPTAKAHCPDAILVDAALAKTQNGHWLFVLKASEQAVSMDK